MLGVIEFTTYNSPPTNVAWLRDGEPVTVDGSRYEMIHIVTGRNYFSRYSYNNRLLVRNAVDLVGYHTYTCTVNNLAGITSKTMDTDFIGK